MIDFRTDLADERYEICKDENKLDGVESIYEKISDKISVNRVIVKNEEGSRILQKKVGNYITINLNDVNILEENELELMKESLKRELDRLINNKNNKNNKNNIIKSFLVVGLGNEDSTADSIGPKVVKNLKITRHILKYEPELISKETKELCAISPGVLGTTGIETQEIIKGVIEKVNVDGIIVIDALSTNNIGRLLKTIQITDTGIFPGSGVENKRKEISMETMNVPVIAIGVPTVVEAATIVANTFEILTNKFDEFKFLKESNYNEEYRLIKMVLDPSNFNLAVMPKEIDDLVDNFKEIISYGINKLV